ncbi:unnamed protein product, partial [Choristocarpus tenellus]
MPCAAGNLCKMPSNTPIPPFYTIRKCRKCGGYLDGICGVKDPELDGDCKRCVRGSAWHCSKSQALMARTHCSSLGSLNGNSSGAAAGSRGQKSIAPSRRGHGTKRSNLTLKTKSEVLDH